METAIDIAEADPQAARDALWSNCGATAVTLQCLEAGADMSPERATLAVGAAIQLASAELASADPDLRSRSRGAAALAGGRPGRDRTTGFAQPLRPSKKTSNWLSFGGRGLPLPRKTLASFMPTDS